MIGDVLPYKKDSLVHDVGFGNRPLSSGSDETEHTSSITQFNLLIITIADAVSNLLISILFPTVTLLHKTHYSLGKC